MTTGKTLRTFAVCVLAFAWAIGAYAQGSTTGSLSGTLSDSSGGVLPGVTVTLAGSNLQGTRRAVTDGDGVYRFRNIPPGSDYKVTATLSGFRETTREAVQVFLGQDGTVNLVLMPAAVTETVRVTASVPMVDVSQTTTGINITSDLFATLPSARSFQQLTTMAPGVTLEMGDHDQRFSESPAVGASSAPENNYIIDGLSVTDPRFGTSGANLTMNFVQEVQVLTGGFQAEYGRSTGGVFNVVTRSGGNQFHGNLFNYDRNQHWTPDNVEHRRNKELATFADRLASYDVGGSVGGPIVTDTVWFFGAYGPIRRKTYLGGQVGDTNPVQRKYDRNSDVYAGKVTLTMSPGHTLVGSVFGDPTERKGWLAGGAGPYVNANADESSALRRERTGGHNVGFKYTGVLSSNWLLDAAYGRHYQRNGLQPDSDSGRNIPRQVDETIGGYEHGGFQRFQSDKSFRDAVSAKFTNVWGRHELR